MDNTENFPPTNPNGENPLEPIDNPPIDPDNPRWSSLAGIGVWFASIAALIVAAVAGLMLWLGIFTARGGTIPVDPEALNQLLMSPPSILIQIIFTILAHLITIAICWAVATGMGKRPLKESIGWNWDEPLLWKKVGIIVGTVAFSFLIFQIVPRLIPDSKTTPFAEMLKASQAVRYVVAFLAVFTAPLVEEFVYRGLLYSPLKRAMGAVGAVTTATLLFAFVHVPQYWGAWGSLIGLLLLSLLLTMVRAWTKSIYPCVAIHTLFNSVGAVGILLGAEQ